MLHAPARVLEAEIVGVESAFAPLSPIEQQVVLLSIADPRDTIGETLMPRRILSLLFATRPSNRLANPRLEALRVFCVRYRFDRCLIEPEAPDVILSLETMLAAAALIKSRSPAFPARDPLLVRMGRCFLPHFKGTR